MILYDNKNSKHEDKEEKEIKKNIFEIVKDILIGNKKVIIVAITIIIVIIIISLYLKTLDNGPVSSKNGLSIELVGKSTLTITKGSSFLDPGYKAIDKDDGDLTKDVQITGILDTDTLGTYTRYYTVINSDGTVVETQRTIVVLAPSEKSILTLTLNGASLINLKLGEKYLEPGYVANDSIEGNLTDKVQVTNNINLNKEGTYQVIYKITNKSGDSKEIYRTIKITKEDETPIVPPKEVVNYNVNITTNTSALTNKNIAIKINITGTGNSYTVLPNSQKTYSNPINYSVAKNDTYIFTVYDVNGDFKTYTITISNIDKTLPIGTCSGDIVDSRTIVKITASDNSGIKNYVYRSGINKSSATTNTTYTFNYQTKTANVLVYDNAGNYKTVTCNIKGEITSFDPLEIGSKTNPKTIIPCKSSRTNYNNELKARVNKAGIRTRNGAVSAAIYLSSVIGYKIPYFYAGGHYHYSWDKGDNFIGVSPQWGCSTKLTVGSTDKQHNGSYYPAGFDCTGFIAWVLVNSGWTTNEVGRFSGDDVKTTWNGKKVGTTSFKGSSGKIKAGDMVWRTGHMGMVIKVEDGIATIAHDKNYESGLVVEKFKLSTGKKVGGSESFTTVMLMDNFYNAG